MHFQTSVPNWPDALVKMPDGSLIKAVSDPSTLVEAIAKWSEAGRDVSKLWTDYRHHNLDYTFSTNLELMREKWRLNFSRFVDATYLDRYAQHVKLIEELNEYTDTRMVTDKELLAPRLVNAQAAVDVWNNEYRGKTLTIDGVTGTIREDCRLVICNSPVGNDIPIEFFELARDDDAVLGCRTYTKWLNKTRDSGDFRWHSGRPFFNEEEYGIKVDYVMGESGPYNGSAEGGWRHGSCMGGDLDLLVSGMRSWIQDLSTTAAYQEGRILGPGAWFTSNTADDGTWKYYLLWEEQLSPLAEMCAEEWRPGTKPPEPPEPPPDPECRGVPREQYRREYWVFSGHMTSEQWVNTFKEAAKSRTTVGWSYDDAGIGDLDNRLAVLWNVPTGEEGVFIDWYAEHYPGVEIEFRNSPQPPLVFEIHDIVAELPSDPSKRQFPPRSVDDITALTIHHTVSGTDRSDIDAINGFHQSTKGWERIGYHFAITETGEIYQTNHLETKSFHAGTNAPGDENLWSVGIALLGNFTLEPPPQVQQDAARWLVGYLRTFLPSDQVLELDVFGHREMPEAQTQCPGNTYEQWLDYVRGIDG